MMQRKNNSGISEQERDRIAAYLAQWGPNPPEAPAPLLPTVSADQEGYVDPPKDYDNWTLVRAVYRQDKQQIRYVLGNEIFVKAVREEAWPVPDGAACAKIAFEAPYSDETAERDV